MVFCKYSDVSPSNTYFYYITLHLFILVNQCTGVLENNKMSKCHITQFQVPLSVLWGPRKSSQEIQTVLLRRNPAVCAWFWSFSGTWGKLRFTFSRNESMWYLNRDTLYSDYGRLTVLLQIYLACMIHHALHSYIYLKFTVILVIFALIRVM